MNIVIDTHTHTVISGHAFSILSENVAAAKKKGLYGIVMTEHGPKMPCGGPPFLIKTYGVVPKFIEGIRVYRGCEANIVNFEGELDIPDKYIKSADFAMAALHPECLTPSDKENNTKAMLNALSNPYVHALAHPGNPAYEIDVEAVVAHAAKLNKCIEINAHSFGFRTGSKPVCTQFVVLCKQYGVKICVGSDAHIQYKIGEFSGSLEVLHEYAFPEELIINSSVERFEGHLGIEPVVDEGGAG